MDRVPTLYHGTDARITRMNGKERNEMIEAVMIARDFLYSLYNKRLNGAQFLISTSDKTLPFSMTPFAPNCYFPADKKDLQSNVQTALSCIRAAQKGNTAYEYLTDGFYLTTLPIRACDFAQGAFAFGELGMFNFRLIQGLKYMHFTNINPTEGQRYAINKVIKFASQIPEPVVYVFNDLNPALLKDERGEMTYAAELDFLFQNCRYMDSSVLHGYCIRENTFPIRQDVKFIGEIPELL